MPAARQLEGDIRDKATVTVTVSPSATTNIYSMPTPLENTPITTSTSVDTENSSKNSTDIGLKVASFFRSAGGNVETTTITSIPTVETRPPIAVIPSQMTPPSRSSKSRKGEPDQDQKPTEAGNLSAQRPGPWYIPNGVLYKLVQNFFSTAK